MNHDDDGGERFTHQEWTHNLEQVDLEIIQLSAACQVDLLEPGVIERVLARDATVCGHDEHGSFDKLRGMLFLHYRVHERLTAELGAEHATRIVNLVRQQLSRRISGSRSAHG